MFLCLPRTAASSSVGKLRNMHTREIFPGVCLFCKLIFPENAKICAKNHAQLLKITKISTFIYIKPRYHSSFPWADVATGIHYGLIYFNIYLEIVRTAVRYLLQNILLSKEDYFQLSASSLRDWGLSKRSGPVMAQLFCCRRDLHPFSAMAGWLLFLPSQDLEDAEW